MPGPAHRVPVIRRDWESNLHASEYSQGQRNSVTSRPSAPEHHDPGGIRTKEGHHDPASILGLSRQA
jgi:hypothetical protein